MTAFPHGKCQCDGPTCCGGNGPAAFEVTRYGKRMRVCTRCDLSSDQDKTLLVQKDEPMEIYADHDFLGVVCIAMRLADAESAIEASK